MALSPIVASVLSGSYVTSMASRLPVGFIYFSVLGTNPATALGYGNWEAVGSGKALIGIDSDGTGKSKANKPATEYLSVYVWHRTA